jgi:hypothetical protein
MSENFDFNTAGEQRSFDVIPDGTIVTLQMKIKPGGAGDGGWLKTAADGASEGLDCEFVVIDGEFAKRKVYNRFTLSGTRENHATASEISRRTLRAILESARGIKPDDKSEAAAAARKISGWQEMDGLRFVARLGVAPPRDGYKAKNTIDQVITADAKEWKQVEQAAKPAVMATPQSAPATPPAGAIARPMWAE